MYDSEKILELSQESRIKMKQLYKEVKPANYTKINHLSGVFVSQMAKSREELYLSNASKSANVSNSILIPNEEFLDDTTPKAAKFDESLAKYKALEWEIERLLRAIIERLQAQLGDHKGKIKDTPCVSNTLDPLPQKLENENVELGFQVQNYEKENAHLKTAYKNLFDSSNVTRAQTKLVIDSLQNKLHVMIYENAKIRAQLFDKVSEQKDTTKGTSINTKFANQSTVRKQFLQSLRNKSVVRQPNAFQSERPTFSKTQVPQMVDKTNDLSNPVTSNSVPTTKEPKVIENDKVIAPGIFRINPFKNSRDVKFVPNKPIKANEYTTLLRPKGHRLGAIQSMIGSLLRLRVVVIQICLWCVDSGCSKHMTGNLKLLINFIWKFLGTVCFGNEHVAAILGFSDLQWGNILITRVYFVEGLGHNLFSVGQFCDLDLEVTFKRNTYFVRNLEVVDLLKANHTTNLYTINLHDMASTSPICLMARATSTKSWLWHQRLSHINFDTINDLARNDLVTDLPKFKYHKEHLCPSCEQGKRKRASHPPKPVPHSKQRLHRLHMDLCGPMRIASINGKWYVLVIMDDYSRYTWVVFLRSIDEAPKEIKTFLKKITVLLQAPVTRRD
ncbi:retrovirus-related pol polyprotein from transposon TNT 1-94 [Tanacetum coccineum]